MRHKKDWQLVLLSQPPTHPWPDFIHHALSTGIMKRICNKSRLASPKPWRSTNRWMESSQAVSSCTVMASETGKFPKWRNRRLAKWRNSSGITILTRLLPTSWSPKESTRKSFQFDKFFWFIYDHFCFTGNSTRKLLLHKAITSTHPAAPFLTMLWPCLNDMTFIWFLNQCAKALSIRLPTMWLKTRAVGNPRGSKCWLTSWPISISTGPEPCECLWFVSMLTSWLTSLGKASMPNLTLQWNHSFTTSKFVTMF